jgi:hypothetical protein
MREPRDPLLKVVLIACDRKDKHSTLYQVWCENVSSFCKKETHAVMHKGVRWMCEGTQACTTFEGQRQPLHPHCYDNDPSAGSPTETLLRLLLPLNDQV